MGNTLFIIIFAGCAIYGVWSVMRRTREIRKPRQYKEALVTWAEPPSLSYRDDFPTWAALNVHRISAIALGGIALLIMIVRPAEMLSPASWPLAAQFLVGPLVVGCVAMLGFLWGYMAGGPLAEAVSGDRHYAVSEAGVLAVGRLLPWEALTHFTPYPDRMAVHIWSASSPGTVAYSFHPPAEEWSPLLGVLQSHLPTREAPSEWRERFGFPLRMAAVCAPFVAAGIVAFWLPMGVVVVGLTVLLWALIGVGGGFIMRSVYGGKSSRAAVSSEAK